MFNLFKRPYSKEDFEDWSKFCYDLAKVSVSGSLVTCFIGNYSITQRVFYVIALLFITYILGLAARKFRLVSCNVKKGE